MKAPRFVVVALLSASLYPPVAGGAEDPLVAAARAARADAKQRRTTTDPARVITTEDLELGRGSDEIPLDAADDESPPPDPTGEPSGASGGEPGADSPPSPVADPLQSPKYWRDRMAAAEARIAELTADLDYARKYLLVVQLGLVVSVDPMREFRRKLEIDQLRAHVAALERELAEVSREPDRIREDGRRARAKPGWLRAP